MKKQATNKVLTKSDLVSVLRNYPTKQDLNVALANYPTKQELREELLDQREGIIDQVDSKMKRYKDEVLQGLDKISKELQDMREEDAAGTLQIRRLGKTVDSHEKRITDLESPQTP